MQRPFVTLLLLGLTLRFTGDGLAQVLVAEADRIVVDRGDDTGLCKVRVPTVNGRVTWEDVARATARVGRLDDRVLTRFPHGDFKVTGFRADLVLSAVNQLLGPEVQVAVVKAGESAEPVLEITVDRDQFRKTSQVIRSEIRRHSTDSSTARLVFPEVGDDPKQPLVVLVHGYNATSSSLQPLRMALTRAGYLCATFSYPNDGPIADAAALLSQELHTVQQKHPHRPVFIVTHSMGGLVARAVVEQAELDPGNVRRLIMIAPPNGGSHWAYIPVGFDSWDAIVTHRGESLGEAIISTVTDGWNEARRDLRPNSRFLRRLDARNRNSNVEYTILLGTGAVAREEDVAELRKVVERLRTENRIGRLVGPRLDEYFTDLDDFTNGKGDGVVAVQRGRLAGIDDVVLLPFRHNAVLRDFDDPTSKQVLDVILARLERASAKP